MVTFLSSFGDWGTSRSIRQRRKFTSCRILTPTSLSPTLGLHSEGRLSRLTVGVSVVPTSSREGGLTRPPRTPPGSPRFPSVHSFSGILPLSYTDPGWNSLLTLRNSILYVYNNWLWTIWRPIHYLFLTEVTLTSWVLFTGVLGVSQEPSVYSGSIRLGEVTKGWGLWGPNLSTLKP